MWQDVGVWDEDLWIGSQDPSLVGGLGVWQWEMRMQEWP